MTKPVVVSMGELAASGGYYVSAPAKMIFANPDTLTGSIGVIAQFLDLQQAAGRLRSGCCHHKERGVQRRRQHVPSHE